MRRLELMAAALDEVVRLHREVMESMRKETGECDDDADERPGPAGEQRPGTA